jgi:hypothetical protein
MAIMRWFNPINRTTLQCERVTESPVRASDRPKSLEKFDLLEGVIRCPRLKAIFSRSSHSNLVLPQSPFAVRSPIRSNTTAFDAACPLSSLTLHEFTRCVPAYQRNSSSTSNRPSSQDLSYRRRSRLKQESFVAGKHEEHHDQSVSTANA